MSKEASVDAIGHAHRDVTEEVDISDLRGDFSPRIGREDLGHARALAEVFEDLPPIVVHRSTMKVIDGMHRVQAARLANRDRIRVTWFGGTEEEAHVEAVRLNCAHGRPLTLRERRQAAQRLLRCHPDWSDRRVAEACGLSPKTAAAVRAATEELPQLGSRVGRDGKRRPAARAPRTGAIRPPADADRPTSPPSEGAGLDLRDDKALCASPVGAELAALFSWPLDTRRDVRDVVAAVPLSRVYVLADEARRRSRWWREVAQALEERAGRRRDDTARP